MEILIIFSGILSFILLENIFTPFSSPDPSMSDAEFTIIINAFICFVVTFIVMLAMN